MTATRFIQIAVSILLLFILRQPLAAQQYPVRVQVQTLQPVSAQLSNLYTGSQARMIVTLLNTDLQKPVLQVRLRLNIKGTTVALRNRDYGSYPVISLEAGIPVQLSLNDLAPYFNIDNMEVSGIPRTQLQQNGKLPDGFYTFCVEVVELNSGQLVSNDKLGCAPPVWISTSEPPLLNLPRKGEAVSFRDPLNIIFNWTPRHMGSPNAAFQTEYEFTLVEIWDTGVLPEAAFGTAPPLYQTTTNSTTLLYGPSEPPLLPGKRYAWRIRAKAKQGLDEFDVFTNNGYTEIFYFTLQEDCDPPQQPAATVQDGRITITWMPQPKMFEYLVEYREQGKDNAAWFNVKTTSTTATIYDAVPGRKYEYRVGGSCTLGNNTLGDLHGFTVPSRDTAASKNCGLLPDIKLANQTPIQELQPDDQIMAGDFPVRLLQVRGAGSFTGYGYITIPFLGYNRLKVKFDNIQVNTDRQLIGGVIMSTFDPLETQVVNVDTVAQAFGDFASVINDLAHLAIDADYLAIKELTEEIKKMAEEELPDELKERIDQAADNLVEAKQAYDEAKKAYDTAQTPEEKAEAKKKMDAAEQKFENAKKEVEAVNKEKEALVKDVADIIITAIKELKTESKNWDKEKELETYRSSMKQKIFDEQGLEEGPDEGILLEIDTVSQIIITDDEMTDALKAYNQLSDDYLKTITQVRGYKIIDAIHKFYTEPASISKFFTTDKALNGSSLLKQVIDEKQKGKTNDELVKEAKASLLDRIITITNAMQ
ncbi:MAG TPA: fibronectin type III domain-containing protein [Chitinophaga sp.]|uniref:fibronectin type III domain-containing protein n=1 Tax=Chitinophaga sp. TaxID=1869181 RepID=UPI002DBB8DFD|nr:fibronectin type III domain-containing protein [Chitinophaga sp.]HEU4553798.1 fibronectin type III domain-containing protein [Chitinophaga sp.]